MKGSIRLAVAACAALVALAFAGPALAVYTPRLWAAPVGNAPGKPTTMFLAHEQGVNDDPTAKDTIYAPLGYRVNLNQAVGGKIGDVLATFILRNGGNAPVDVEGQVIADNPAAHPSDPCAPGLHQAVWKLNVTVTGTPLTIYVYVDAITAGPEAAFASAKIEFCLDPIGTPPGAQLIFAFFNVDGVFTNPPNKAPRVWRATFTPFTPGTPPLNPNPSGMTEGQALVPGRISLTLTTKRLKRGNVLIQGRLLTDGKPTSGVEVKLYALGKTSKQVAKAFTNRGGGFTIRRRIKKTTLYGGIATLLGRSLQSCPAAPIPTVPQGCKTATISFTAISNLVRARPRK